MTHDKSGLPIEAHEVRRLSAVAEVHPKTTTRYFAGKPIRGSSRARIERALRAGGPELPEGLELSTPADVAAADKMVATLGLDAARDLLGFAEITVGKIRTRQPVARFSLISFRLSAGLAVSVEQALVQLANERAGRSMAADDPEVR